MASHQAHDTRGTVRPIAPAVALGLAFVLAGCVDPPTDISVTTYRVNGVSNATLERSLALHGPEVTRGEPRAFAAVETTFLHSFDAQEVHGACRYGPGQVGLRSVVTLPDWTQRAKAAPELRAKWDVLLQYARIHESGHIHISQGFARRLAAVYRREQAADCATLERLTRHSVEPIATAHVRAQQEWDRTDPGRFKRYLRKNGYTLDDGDDAPPTR